MIESALGSKRLLLREVALRMIFFNYKQTKQSATQKQTYNKNTYTAKIIINKKKIIKKKYKKSHKYK